MVGGTIFATDGVVGGQRTVVRAIRGSWERRGRGSTVVGAVSWAGGARKAVGGTIFVFVGVVGASERDLTVGGTIERSFDGQKDQRTKFWWSEGP